MGAPGFRDGTSPPSAGSLPSDSDATCAGSLPSGSDATSAGSLPSDSDATSAGSPPSGSDGTSAGSPLLASASPSSGRRSGADGAGPVIDARALWRTYDLGEVEVRALRGVDIRVERGEFVAIMGPSGSGKSTTMNILGCLDRPTAGTYLLDGIEVSSMTRDEQAHIRNRKLGFVFQGFNLLARTSALENVELPMLYSGRLNARARRERAVEALTAVGLGERIHHVPTRLSGGEQQRVAIARALVNEPSLLLADEPTGNLDSRTSLEVLSIFQDLNASRSLTIILVTHEPDVALHAHRIITFRDGRILSDRPVENPRDARAELAALRTDDL